jgi:hypothetical protein
MTSSSFRPAVCRRPPLGLVPDLTGRFQGKGGFAVVGRTVRRCPAAWRWPRAALDDSYSGSGQPGRRTWCAPRLGGRVSQAGRAELHPLSYNRYGAAMAECKPWRQKIGRNPPIVQGYRVAWREGKPVSASGTLFAVALRGEEKSGRRSRLQAGAGRALAASPHWGFTRAGRFHRFCVHSCV